MKLNDDKLAKFKHDVGNLLYKMSEIEKEMKKACKQAKVLMEEFLEIIDQNED